MVVLGLLWMWFHQFHPSKTWADAHDIIIANISPRLSADIRSAHYARSESENDPIPKECYAALQWSVLAVKFRESIGARAATAILRAWRTLRGADPDAVSTISSEVSIQDGHFDLTGIESVVKSVGAVLPESDSRAEKEALGAKLALILEDRP